MTDAKGRNANWSRRAVWTCECGRYFASVQRWINGSNNPYLFYAQVSDDGFYLGAGDFYSLAEAQDAAYAIAIDPKTPQIFEQLREACEEFDQETAAAKAEFDETFGGLDGLGDCE